MLKWYAVPTVLCLLVIAGGCGGDDPVESQGDIEALYEALDRYEAGSMHEPIDTPENEARILELLSKLIPLEGDREIEAVLDVFLSYDATDNTASARAREMLVQHGKAALPLVRARLAMSQAPEQIHALIADIEAD